MTYDLLFRVASETMLTADPRHPGARIGIIAVLHIWDSVLTHHPLVHMVVPGDGMGEAIIHFLQSMNDKIYGRFKTLGNRAFSIKALIRFFPQQAGRGKTGDSVTPGDADPDLGLAGG